MCKRSGTAPYCRILVLTMIVLGSSSARGAEGVLSVPSPHTVEKTADRLMAVLGESRIEIFARINHAKDAATIGVSLRPTELIIFGDPKVDAALEVCRQSVALDLPQKALIWEDPEGRVWLSYNDPRYLEQRHGLAECEPLIAKMENVLADIAATATQP